MGNNTKYIKVNEDNNLTMAIDINKIRKNAKKPKGEKTTLILQLLTSGKAYTIEEIATRVGYESKRHAQNAISQLKFKGHNIMSATTEGKGSEHYWIEEK